MDKDNIQLIIPMSGIGKRFLDAGYTEPKPLIEIDGKPMIEHVLDMFPGVEDVVFICNRQHIEETNMKDILDSACPNGRVVIIEKHKKGPVYAVSKIFDMLDDNKKTIVSYCDFGTVWDFDKFLESVDTFDGGIACYTGFHPHMLGSDNYAFCKEEGLILQDIKEKEPFTDNKMNEYASNGTYYFGSGAIVKKYFQRLMDADINLKGEYYVSLVYKMLLEDGLRTRIYEIDKMLQWGTPYDLEIYRGWSDCFKNVEEVDSQEFTLVLPMSGRGERFSKEGFDRPKPLIPVDDMPMIIKAVECLPKFKDAVFICLEDHIRDYNVDNVLKSYYANAQICSVDSVTEGQACTCEIGINCVDMDPEAPILISACDNGAYYDQQKFLNMIKDKTNDVVVWSFRNNQTSKVNPDMYSWLDVDDDDNIKNVSCKKFIGGDPLTKHAIIGTMYFRKAKYFIEGLRANYAADRRTNGEFYVDDVINRNIEDALTVKVFEVDNYVCWGTPNDYKTYNYWKEHFTGFYKK